MEDIIEYLSENLSKKRYDHVIRVCDIAKELSIIHGVDSKKVELAALLHDITKEKTDEWSVSYLKEKNEQLPDSRNLYHALTGSYYIQDFFDIKDKEIINAVKFHTIGNGKMSSIAKIIYVVYHL